jgi:putative oxygen-independent coproporphyrinogen III oxidase
VDPLTGMSAARFGVYVHFPYCLSKCPYCDFASVVAKQVPEARYADAVLAELDARIASWPRGRRIDSLFFGGGTPSLWSAARVARVVAGITERLPLAAGAEVTLEANPGAADASRFSEYRAAGVNRLSIGAQSFEPAMLAFLGRAHDGAAVEAAFRAARVAGFDNVSLDFIYGVPGQSVATAAADARRATALGSEHLSAYALTLEREALAEEVPLAKQLAQGLVSLPPEEEVVAMQSVVQEVYAAAGLARYEISNYARAGFHSRHNTLYWTGGEYLALGAGATGYTANGEGGVRYSNHRSAEQYLTAVETGRLPQGLPEALGRRELFAERLAMGLRLSSGIDVETTCKTFGEAWDSRAAEVNRLVGRGLARWSGARLSLTDPGANLHSAISAALL